MAQRKNHEVDGWIARPDRAARVILFYGPDRGLVAERAARFAAGAGLDLADPFSVVRLDAAEVETHPERLYEEVQTVSMFTQSRLIWVRNASGGRQLADAIKTLIAGELRDIAILIEAGDLKKGAGLRGIVEAASAGMALPCYSDDARALDALIEDILGRAGLQIGLAARNRLKAHLGGDRMASRGELEKLALFCHGSTEVAVVDVDRLIGDVSATTADDAINAALRGDPAAFQQAYGQFRSGGGNPTTLLLSALRQVHGLHALSGEMELNNRSASAVVASARPPLYFERKTAAERALGRLTSAQWDAVVHRLSAAVLESRKHADLADVIIERSLLALSASGRAA
ncbi:MAG TPA: DNA polymerase III subunit delta [Tianweitania sediminis]|jgi:DNA polymerase-3 subunit delta|nr:DNA polymerase III subunit delta [Tianweitania sediminis]